MSSQEIKAVVETTSEKTVETKVTEKTSATVLLHVDTQELYDPLVQKQLEALSGVVGSINEDNLHKYVSEAMATVGTMDVAGPIKKALVQNGIQAQIDKLPEGEGRDFLGRVGIAILDGMIDMTVAVAKKQLIVAVDKTATFTFKKLFSCCNINA